MRRAARLLGLIATSVILAAGAAPADMPDHISMRRAGEALAGFGAETRDPDMLLAGLSLLLKGGARIEAGSPWGADTAYDLLRALIENGDASRQSALERLLDARRGVTGPNRVGFRLDPGQTEIVPIGVMPGELAMVEVRLRRESGMADVDLLIVGGNGEVIAQETGPETGRVNRGLLLEWRPDSCRTVDVAIRNVGAVVAEGVFFAPEAQDRAC